MAQASGWSWDSGFDQASILMEFLQYLKDNFPIMKEQPFQ